MKRGNMAAACIPTRQQIVSMYIIQWMVMKPVSVELYSQEGKLLYSNRVGQPNGQVSIPASGYNTGVYVVKLKQGNILKTFQVVKQ